MNDDGLRAWRELTDAERALRTKLYRLWRVVVVADALIGVIDNEAMPAAYSPLFEARNALASELSVVMETADDEWLEWDPDLYISDLEAKIDKCEARNDKLRDLIEHIEHSLAQALQE